ncbi:MAG: TIGR03960 family B12-binding radical SAM protein [Dethiobacteria bacterium]|jgi:radical SAM family uncharacterized protein|nr:TIGR03960 family B12-binding radical SAM protein [Bacillota bacterium]
MKLEQRINGVLPRVTNPARYIGNEWNSVHKEPSSVKARLALAFPDLYEVGMSHLGFKILYQVINKREQLAAERVFAPALDMEKEMRHHRIPLFSLESFTPLRDFDFVGFTLQYELSYTNILNMLDLAGIPRFQSQRTDSDPFILGGGPGAFNPEPLAPFFDAFILGDGEEVVLEILDLYLCWQGQKGATGERGDFLRKLAGIPGIYIPSFYRAHYDCKGNFSGLEPLEAKAPQAIIKRISPLRKEDYPTKPVVPNTGAVHDRAMLELFRGCTRGCRFCQAGIIYRPVRERKKEDLKELAQKLLRETGYEEVSLTSLSSSDYPNIEGLVHELFSVCGDDVNLSLPSLRLDSFSVKLAEEIQKVRKSGLTFAPEAGTQRLRDVINKNVSEENLLQAAADAFSSGWTNLKLYFMIGLPTETEEDLEGIVTLVRRVAGLYREKKGNFSRLRLSVSASTFVPKAHTPFQWEPQITIEENRKRQRFLAERLRRFKGVRFSYSEPEMSLLEAVLARGDRRLAPVIAGALDNGCRFDSWGEHFNFNGWQKAFSAANVCPDTYAYKKFAPTDPLPWDHLHTGVSKSFLLREYQRAMEQATTPDCRERSCQGCGIENCPIAEKSAGELQRQEEG